MTQEPLISDITTDIAEQFRTLYKEKYGNIPSSPWPVYAADALYAIVGAIRNAGSTESDAIASAMHTNMAGVEGVTGSIEFSDRGDRLNVPYKMYEVTADGKYVVHQS